MADPTENLGIQTGNPDAGTAGMGLVTPDLLAQQRIAQWQGMLNQTAEMNPYRAIGLMAGRGVGQAATQFAGGAGLQPIDPMMQQARQNQVILNSANAAASQAGQNPYDQQEAYYRAIYQATGRPDALAALTKIRAERVKEMQTGADINEKNAQADKAGRMGRQATADEVAAYTRQFGPLPPGRGLVIDANGTPQVIGGGGVNVNVNNGQKAGIDEAYKVNVDDLKALRANARAAVQVGNSVNEARSLLDQGIISGSAAEQRLGVNKLLATFGATDGDLVARTNKFISIMKPLASSSFKQSMGGGLSRVTQWELQMMQAAKGGDITTLEKGLREMLDDYDRGGREAVDNYNQQLDRVIKPGDDFSKVISRGFAPSEYPTPYKPATPTTTSSGDPAFDAAMAKYGK